jgi:DNA-3-methyladenine glycosylase I
MTKNRCPWSEPNPLLTIYHDNEWGIPIYDDCKLFELLTLEGAQAGLSWLTILKRRAGYNAAFAGFNPQQIIQFTPEKLAQLMLNPDIIRNRLKIHSVVKNAQAFLKIQEEYNSFSQYIWQFVEGETIKNAWRKAENVPTRTTASDNMSKGLRNRGFTFVGTTICYAFMQATGMVNDHLISCFRHKER